MLWLSIEYKDPYVFKKNVSLSFKDKLLINLFLIIVFSVTILLRIIPLFLLKKKIIFFWLAAINLFLDIFKLDLKGIL